MDSYNKRTRQVPTLHTCANKWIRMTDKNCKAAIGWYRACASLADSLTGSERDQFTTALIENIKSTSDDYFRNSYRPLSTLSVIQRELGYVVESIMYPPQYSTEDLKVKPETKWEDLPNSFKNTRSWLDHDTLVKAIVISGAVAITLTIVIVFIMCLYCIQYKKMKERLKEIEYAAECGVNLCPAGGCECGKRLWDTGEACKYPCGDQAESEETDEGGDSENDVGIRFTTIRIAPELSGSKYSLSSVKTSPHTRN